MQDAARLLIVDDVDDNRAILKRRFQRLGYEIMEAACGARALELIEAQPFDLVLLDVVMPGMDGLQVLAEIRTTRSASVLPVIMVTARATVDDVVAALELGANDYVTKPVDLTIAQARVSVQVARKRAEDASRLAREELELVVGRLQVAMEASDAALRAKSEFLANMSHELRTPLNGIIGIASALKTRGATPEQRELITILERSTRHLEHLVSDILDSARLESGELQINNAPFDLAAVAHQSATLFREDAALKNVQVEVTVAPEVGIVVGDEIRVQQILHHLLSNAVKFTDTGRVWCNLGREEDGGCVIEVGDTGAGFDPELSEAIFERFRQADGAATRRHGGTGLGLAICRDLVHLMGGSIVGSGHPGEGAVFVLRLPLPPVDVPLPGKVGAPEDDGDTGARLRVLIADDNEVNRRVIHLLLDPSRFDVLAVFNGAEAVAAAGQAQFDVVLMDIQMPVMDGLSAIREIRRQVHPAPPFVVLSANSDPEDIRRSMEAGALAHVPKPISPTNLLFAIASALELATRPLGPERVRATGS